MPILTLPDGQTLNFDSPVSVYQGAEAIGSGLAKTAIAGRVNDALVDLSYVIREDATLSLIKSTDDDGIDIIRHSTAHLLAQAIKRLYPQAQLAIGPTTDNGFYYDLDLDKRLSEEDLPEIEATMQAIVEENHEVKRLTLSHEEAVAFYKARNEPYKVEILNDMADEEVSFYQQGEFIDLCRGPHVPSTGRLKAFKLMSLAGAYWRGDSNRPMLQRIYGTAWPDKKALKAYLKHLEEAAKRDHRLLAKKMNLFHIQEEAPGMVFWHPAGWRLYQTIQSYLREKMDKYGYHEINTPQILARSLWEASGHWEKFEDDMFLTHSESHEYLVKPMNCPCHVQVFNQGVTSYRDLPLRLSEFGSCHRNEPSGTLHGLLRVRHFVQDDAHIFCSEDQIHQEVTGFIHQLLEVYRDFGFHDILFYLSTRPEKRIGSDALWDKAERALEQSLNNIGVSWTHQAGEGAFYGPKIEFSLKDCLGRLWQCGTMQVDFFVARRLGAQYVTESGDRKPPVMLHRAIFGSLERFIGILLEEYSGQLPLWLAPTQLVLMNITDDQRQYCEQLNQRLKEAGIRVELDLRNEKVGYKIREHSIRRVPYLLVVGDREVENQQVNVRTHSGENRGPVAVDTLIKQIKLEIKSKTTALRLGARHATDV